MSAELRALLLLGAGLAPAAAWARPPAAGAAELLARHRLPIGEGAATGRALLAGGDVPGALAAFQQALAEDPASIIGRNGLAACYERLGRDDLARQYYEQALVLAPDSALLQVNLGGLLVRTGEAAAAVPWLQNAATSSDAELAAAARRLLMLADATLRKQAITAATMPPAQRADVQLIDGVSIAAAAPARIVTAASGEVRLVSAAPPSELVARLGDDAALAEPPRPWRAEDDAVVQQTALLAMPTVAASRRLVVPVSAASLRADRPTRSGPPSLPPLAGAQPAGAFADLHLFRRPVPDQMPMAPLQRPEPRATSLPAYRQDEAAAPLAVLAASLSVTSARLTIAAPAQRRAVAPADLFGIAGAWRRFAADAPRPSAPGGLPGLRLLLSQALV